MHSQATFISILIEFSLEKTTIIFTIWQIQPSFRTFNDLFLSYGSKMREAWFIQALELCVPLPRLDMTCRITSIIYGKMAVNWSWIKPALFLTIQ